MSSQKIPLFANGLPFPMPDPGADPTISFDLFTAPDAALKGDAKHYYEVDLWWNNENGAGDITVFAYPAGDLASAGAVVFTGSLSGNAGQPRKLLDKYLIRGNTTLRADIEGASFPSSFWGFYRRVGEGDVARRARRFIPDAASINAGIPVVGSGAVAKGLAPGEKTVIHQFEKGRIDNINLWLSSIVNGGAAPIGSGDLIITFEDVNNTVLHTLRTYPVAIGDSIVLNGGKYFDDIPFGGAPGSSLDHLSVESDSGNVAPSEIFVWGDFDRG